jgi:hypothetical protein
LTEGKTVDGGTSEPQLVFVNRGLFSDHFLQARLPEWKEWEIDTELVAFHESLRSLYDSKKPILPHLNEAQTELEFVQPVLDLLGYADSYIVQAPTKVGQHTNRPDYALFPDVKTKNKAYQKLDQNDYSLCIGIADAKYWERELDIAKSSDRDTFTNQNPSFQVAAYLTGTKQNWGILTNGRLWRLYSSKSHLPLGNYYQVDLVQLLEDAPVEVLKYFYVLFRKQALLQVEGKSLLDRILEGSEEYAVELEADIKERAYNVVELLCRGFAAEFTHAQLTDAALKSIYDNSLTLLYRLLFVFYAEARELLPLTANASYRENYSLRRLTHDIDETMKKGYELSTSSTQYYHYIGGLFHLINNGDPKLGIPEYNGGLFDPTEHQFLEKQAIPDAYLVRAIHQLARITDKKLGREVAVDYNTLSERHLGSVYEGLLEFKPMIAPHDLVTIKDKGSIKYAPAKKHPGKKIVYTKDELYLANDKGERKASGSYYTPEYIVNYIVENTLDPLIEEAHEKVKALKPEVDKAIAKWQKLKEQKQGLEPTEKYDHKIIEESERLLEPYLSLKVLDPAMGSGHFLARATDFLAEAIATDPDIKSPLELTEESELTYYRRRVVESCIYGVDLNPLAVELAKLTLWLTTMAKSKPLSFLNHHLRVGNSLIGARIGDLDEIPKAKAKKKAIDPSRAPVQLGLFQEAFNKQLYDLLQNRALIAKLPTETLADVHNKQKWEKDFEHKMERFRTLADVWVSTFFSNKVAWDNYNTLIENLQSSKSDWEMLVGKKYVQNSLDLREHYRFFQWELEFPEVFYDDQCNRKVDAGFDAVIGNPPYVGIRTGHIDESLVPFFSSRFTTCVGNWDLFGLFIEQSLAFLNQKGGFSFIIPERLGANRDLLPLREMFYREGGPSVFGICGKAFEDPQVRAAVIVHSRSKCDNNIRVQQLTPDQAYDVGTIAIQAIQSLPDKPISVGMVGPALHVMQKLEQYTYPLVRLVEFIRGMECGQNDPNVVFEAGSKLRSVVSGEAVNRFEIIEQDMYMPEGLAPKTRYKDSTLFRVVPKLLLRFVGSRPIGALDTYGYMNFNTVYNGLLREESQHLANLDFLLALINSSFTGWWFRLVYLSEEELFPHIQKYQLDSVPIRPINFTTLEEERKQLFEKAKKLYQEYLSNQNCDKILAFVSECLPIKEDGAPDTDHEQSDVVHDLLAFLVKEMTRLNEEKQSAIKHFLTWLEKDILKGSIEDQKNKTKIRNFHECTLEELMDVLKKNKAIPDPCPSNIWDTIAGEFSAAVNALGPLKTRIIMTDKLIDQIVYKLYNLTNEEIAIVERSGTS